jgi:hypothetical protein
MGTWGREGASPCECGDANERKVQILTLYNFIRYRGLRHSAELQRGESQSVVADRAPEGSILLVAAQLHVAREVSPPRWSDPLMNGRFAGPPNLTRQAAARFYRRMPPPPPRPRPLPRPRPRAPPATAPADPTADRCFLGASSTSSASRFNDSGRSQARMVDPRTDKVAYGTGFLPRLCTTRTF